ncbi:SAM-dependent methyltransferase [Flavobacterium psychrophilum]|uniref:HsdM family class I SAM-dependent methyltransferase n=1 Tax=Flavobacterium psychrophilum TaxID=96345 RepID=UPI000903412B|nr:N-6 DNA methylase [Flavobacterium psychrophilum]MCB6231683.1 SAM-dependent methyltransferase [Flavobacterium psychrophilum]OJH12973.1 endonuclease [Flavobacterium psychrophilum]SNA84038.1 putative type I endonuclease-methyltransferase fusion protein [Flavobacterium psychrophilum]
MNSSIINNLDIIDFAKDCNVFDIDLFENEKFGVVKVYGNEDQPALFLKEVDSFNFKTLKQIAEIQKASWNFQKVLFLYVYTKTEIRIYNCSEKPFGYEENIQENEFTNKLKELELYSCKETDNDKLKKLNILFSRIAIDTGFIWSSIEAKEIKDKINLQNRVDKFLIQSLINVSRELEEQGLTDKNLIHKLVMRSLFLLYLEDRGATKKEFYGEFSLKAESYLDLLKQGEVNYVYSLFEKLAEDFNGSLFNIEENEINLVTREHLDLIRQCFTSGYTKSNQIKLFSYWRLFNFSIIRIELLSEIYENFLSELDKKAKKNTGTFYTPPSLVELILNEKLPVRNNETDYKVKTLDPSCGSGIFLVQSFKRLVKRYENKHKSKLNDFNILIDILKSNIFGIELDGKSIKVAAFSLYLALLDNLDPKTDWWNGTIKFPYLINDNDDESLKEQGNNLFKRDTISDLSEIKKLQNFDLIVGNPPFGTKKLLPTITAYCEKENFAQEMVLPFLHKATLLAPKGKIALIFNTKVLTNTGGTYQNFRKWLFNKKYVEKIYNFSILRKAPKFSGGQLFGSAVGPISIVFYQNETPENSKDTITYYAPKTYIKNDVLEGIVIDSSDEKHLPRIECKKPNSKIWKIAMWGSFFDFELIEKLEKKHNTLENYFETNKNEWLKGSGLHSPDKKQIEKNKFFLPSEVINTRLINKYYTSRSALVENSKIYRPTNELLYKSPFLIIKEGQKEKEFCSSVIDFDCYHMSYSVVNNNIQILKVLSAYINSVFSNYYLSLSSASWGIERERVQSNEMLELPAIIEKLELKSVEKLSSKIDEIISIKKSNELNHNTTHIEKQIDQIIYNDILKLTEDEQIVIQDTLNYSLDLFEKKEKSKAVLPVNDIDVYTKRITKELNDWLDDDDLKISATHYKIDRNCPLYLVKLSFGNQLKEIEISKENIYSELKTLDKKLWSKDAQSIYFRKKLNYFDGDDIYIIKPNQRRFWSQTAAMEDSKSLLVEILNMKE